MIKQVRTHARLYIHSHLHTQNTNTCKHSHTLAQTCTRAHTLSHTHTHTQARTHARTHAHIHNLQTYDSSSCRSAGIVYSVLPKTRSTNCIQEIANVCHRSCYTSLAALSSSFVFAHVEWSFNCHSAGLFRPVMSLLSLFNGLLVKICHKLTCFKYSKSTSLKPST